MADKSFTEKHSLLIVSLVTAFYLIVPGLLEAVSSGLNKFQHEKGWLAFVIWLNLWLGTIIFLYSKNLKNYFNEDSFKKLLIKICNSLASLKFTVFLLGVSLILVFVGTIAQTELGIWEVVEQFFQRGISRVKFAYFFRGEVSESVDRLHYFLPGGYTLGVLFLVNLLAAHS